MYISSRFDARGFSELLRGSEIWLSLLYVYHRRIARDYESVFPYIHTMALGMQTSAQVLLPEADQGIGVTGAVWDGKTELPVLYLLHGSSDDSSI